jgi:hypothetical protein
MSSDRTNDVAFCTFWRGGCSQTSRSARPTALTFANVRGPLAVLVVCLRRFWLACVFLWPPLCAFVPVLFPFCSRWLKRLCGLCVGSGSLAPVPFCCALIAVVGASVVDGGVGYRLFALAQTNNNTMANINNNNNDMTEDVPTLNLQPMVLEPDAVTEELAALAEAKRVQSTQAQDQQLIQDTEAFLSNPDMGNLESARAMLVGITDLNTRAKVAKQIELQEERNAKVSRELSRASVSSLLCYSITSSSLKVQDGRYATMAAKLLGPVCMNMVRGEQCIRPVDPKLGVSCKPCHKNWKRPDRNASPAVRFATKEQNKRDREQQARRAKAALVMRINAEQQALIKDRSDRKRPRMDSCRAPFVASGSVRAHAALEPPPAPLPDAAAVAPTAAPMPMSPVPGRATSSALVPTPAASPVTAATRPIVVVFERCIKCGEDTPDTLENTCPDCVEVACGHCMADHLRTHHQLVACVLCPKLVTASPANCCNNCSAYACNVCKPRHQVTCSAPLLLEDDDDDVVAMDSDDQE